MAGEPQSKWYVDDLQAVEPDELPKWADVLTFVSDDLDSMGFNRVSVVADSRERLLEYVRDGWGEDGDWFRDHVEARIVEMRWERETLPDGSQVDSLWFPDANDPWLVREVGGADDENPDEDAAPREFLVHLTVQVPAEFTTDAEIITRELLGALEVGTDSENTPTLAVATVEVTHAEWVI